MYNIHVCTLYYHVSQMTGVNKSEINGYYLISKSAIVKCCYNGRLIFEFFTIKFSATFGHLSKIKILNVYWLIISASFWYVEYIS